MSSGPRSGVSGQQPATQVFSHPAERAAGSWIRLLLLLPFIGVLWVPSYNSIEPAIDGVPFFYWYQFLWIFISAGLVYLVYRAEN